MLLWWETGSGPLLTEPTPLTRVRLGHGAVKTRNAYENVRDAAFGRPPGNPI